MVRKSYTEKQFKKDLSKLNKLINSFNQSGGSNCLKQQRLLKKILLFYMVVLYQKRDHSLLLK